MRVLGIDPGTISMGYGLVRWDDETVAEDWGAVSLNASMPIERRLYQLYTHVINMVNLWQPDAIAVEEPFMGKGENQFVASALAIGQAQALVLIAGGGLDIPIKRYSPAQVKRTVADHGAATKDQVQQMVKIILDLEEVPSPSDAADALAIALCHIREVQFDEVLDRQISPGQEAQP